MTVINIKTVLLLLIAFNVTYSYALEYEIHNWGININTYVSNFHKILTTEQPPQPQILVPIFGAPETVTKAVKNKESKYAYLDNSNMMNDDAVLYLLFNEHKIKNFRGDLPVIERLDSQSNDKMGGEVLFYKHQLIAVVLSDEDNPDLIQQEAYKKYKFIRKFTLESKLEDEPLYKDILQFKKDSLTRVYLIHYRGDVGQHNDMYSKITVVVYMSELYFKGATAYDEYLISVNKQKALKVKEDKEKESNARSLIK